MDKESYDCEEYISSSETASFPAEEYAVKETANSAKESYSAPETSTSQKSTSQATEEGMSYDDAQDMMQSSSSTSSSTQSTTSSSSTSTPTVSTSVSTTTTAAASATAGATTALATSVITICAATIVGAVVVPGLDIDSSNTTTVDYGTFEYENYKVDYTVDKESGAVYANVLFNFDGELLENCTCRLSDNETGESIEVTSQSVEISNIENKDRTFNLSIYKEGKVIKSQTINFEDHYLCGQNNDSHYIYKSTINEDYSYNIYTSLKTNYDGDFVTFIELDSLFDDYGLLEGYDSVIDGNYSSVSNIFCEAIKVHFVSYYVLDNNYYYYYDSEDITIGDGLLDFEANVIGKDLTISFDNKMIGDITINVIHDDTSNDTFIVNAEDLVNNVYQTKLSKYSQNPIVEVFATAAIYNNDPLNELLNTIGEEYFEAYDARFIEAVLNSTIELLRSEILNSSYYSIYSDSGESIYSPVVLYFDGYLNYGDTYSIQVYLGNEMITSKTDLTSVSEGVVLLDLATDSEYTFKYYITIDGEESLVGEKTLTLSMVDSSNLPSPYCANPNPGDALVTYNGDGTSNVYLYMNVQETTYDMYYKVYLIDNTDNTIYYECNSNENVAVFKDIPTGQYSLRYGVMLNIEGTCYSVFDMAWPSGSINLGLDENGYCTNECGSANYNSSTGELSIDISGKVTNDMHIFVITEDGGLTYLTSIALNDITIGNSYSECVVDLSSYGLGETSLAIIGDAIFAYGDGDAIKAEIEITGSESCAFKIEVTN